jgi:hypothetical protein
MTPCRLVYWHHNDQQLHVLREMLPPFTHGINMEFPWPAEDMAHQEILVWRSWKPLIHFLKKWRNPPLCGHTTLGITVMFRPPTDYLVVLNRLATFILFYTWLYSNLPHFSLLHFSFLLHLSVSHTPLTSSCHLFHFLVCSTYAPSTSYSTSTHLSLLLQLPLCFRNISTNLYGVIPKN